MNEVRGGGGGRGLRRVEPWVVGKGRDRFFGLRKRFKRKAYFIMEHSSYNEIIKIDYRTFSIK